MKTEIKFPLAGTGLCFSCQHIGIFGYSQLYDVNGFKLCYDHIDDYSNPAEILSQPEDEIIQARDSCFKALELLDKEAKARVLKYLMERFSG
jgi:hypothetical protein